MTIGQLLKKSFFLLLFSATLLNASAQKPDAAKAQAQMRQVQKQIDDLKKNHPEIQQAMDDYKRQMPEIQRKLDSAAMKNPELANIKLPDLKDAGKLPDMDKIFAEQKERTEQLNKVRSKIVSANKDALPVASNRIINESDIDETKIKSWAQAMKQPAAQWLGMIMTHEMDEIYADTSANPASAGMMMIAMGMPKYTGQYLVCRTLIDHPDNAMAINDLGIFYRCEKDYDRAIQCFLHAQKLNDSCTEIKANLGWAYAYAGNFSKAKNYVNAILNKRPDYGTALEGLSLIAYQEGDRMALRNNLAKQMLNCNRTGGFGGTPSPQMASFCAGVLTEEEINRMDKGGDDKRPDDKTLSNPNGPDPDKQADEENLDVKQDIEYMEYKEDIPMDASKHTAQNVIQQMNKYDQDIKHYQDNVAMLLKKLPKPMQFINDQGEMEITPDYGADPHYTFFHQTHVEFNRRTTKIYGEYNDKVASASQSFAAAYAGVFKAYVNATKACAEPCKNDTNCECIRKVKCDYMPKLSGTIRSFIMSIGDITATAAAKLDDQGDWYISASSPMIQFIPQQDWNRYMNAIREADLRTTKLRIMSQSMNASRMYLGYMAVAKGLEVPEDECRFELNTIPRGVPTPKWRKLKTYPEPCHTEPSTLNLGPLHGVDDCNHWRISLVVSKNKIDYNNGPLKAKAEAEVSAFFEKIKSRSDDDPAYYRGGLELHAKAEFDFENMQQGKLGLLAVKTGSEMHGKAEVTVDAFQAWDVHGRPMKKGFSYDANASLTGGINLSAGIGKANNNLINQVFEKGAHSSGEYSAVYGADGSLSSYGFRNVTGSTTNK